MDEKSVFLNGYIVKEVYIEQPLGSRNKDFPNYVISWTKNLLGLKQAPQT